jgi:hypothetical protein
LTVLFQLDPLQDERWLRLIARRPEASIFHTPEWLKALQSTYGYQPVAYTTCRPGTEISSGYVFCRVKSWLTGQRLVSLPFSDHANFLGDDQNELGTVLTSLRDGKEAKQYKYIEIRPTHVLTDPAHFQQSDAFYLHRLSLEDDLNVLFARFHKSCVQRKITRAVREKVHYAAGRSEELLRDYYRLCVLTHRRHGLPPQPMRWFRNLAECLGEMFTIHLAYLNGRAIAGVVMLSFKRSLFYKYGASDAAHHNSGAVPFLFWEAIQEAKKRGCVELNFGRTDMDNAGLVNFKEHWGAQRSKLTYWRYPAGEKSPSRRWQLKAAQGVFNVVPAAGPVAGRFLYRHIG